MNIETKMRIYLDGLMMIWNYTHVDPLKNTTFSPLTD